MGFPGGTSGIIPTCQCSKHEMWIQLLGWEDPLEESMATHSSILAQRIPWAVRHDWRDLAAAVAAAVPQLILLSPYWCCLWLLHVLSSNPFCLCPGQQATTCSASSTRIYKSTPNQGKYHSPLDGHCYKAWHCYKALSLETSKRGRPNAPCHPSSAGSSQRDFDVPIPKELGLPSLEQGMLGS